MIAQGSFGHLVVIRDRETTIRRINMPQPDVATSLVVDTIADLAQCLDDIAARDAR
jgi:hypothetical protein